MNLNIKPKTIKLILSGMAGVLIIVFSALIYVNGQGGAKSFWAKRVDRPPAITLVWYPEFPSNLKEFKGKLFMEDDKELDFTTYQFTVEEIGKTVGLPIDGIYGASYESDIFLGLIADNPLLKNAKEVTLVVSIADKSGQKTTIRRVVKLKR